MAARDMARAHIAFYAGGMGTFYNRMLQRFGWAEEAERISREWARPDREGRPAAAAAVTDEMLDWNERRRLACAREGTGWRRRMLRASRSLC